jgi:ribosomal protein L15
MSPDKIKKRSRSASSRTIGRGPKGGRGKGLKGGHGLAGGFKHRLLQKIVVVKKKLIPKNKASRISIMDLNNILDSQFPTAPTEIDLNELGYTKLLGTGTYKYEFILKIKKATPLAQLKLGAKLILG